VVGVHVTPTVFFNVRKTTHRKKCQGTDHCPREWKSAGSAVASLRLSGENGWQRTWFDGQGHRWGRMHDMLGFICGVYMGDWTEVVLVQVKEWEKRIISHSRTSITKLLWALANILEKHVLVIEKKNGEEIKRKKKKPTTVMSR
jgi:hypothetical protein